jgi:flagellar assembly protein FliH
MKKMDSYKTKIFKEKETVNSGKAVPLASGVPGSASHMRGAGKNLTAKGHDQESGQTEKKTLVTDAEFKKVGEEFYQKGFLTGAQSKNKEVTDALEALNTLFKTVPLIKTDIIDKAHEQIVKLAIAIAEKVLNQEVTTHKDVIVSVLKNALKNIAETEGMKIRLNPQDFRYMMEVKKDFLQTFDGLRNVVFEEDTSIKRGGAVIETMFGEVDARLESQLKEIKSAMLQG